MKQIDSILFASFILTVQLCSLSATTAACSTPDISLQTETAKNQRANNVSIVQHNVERDRSNNNVINSSVQRSIQETTQERAEPRLGVINNSYYDFLINEGSYKFWAVFQLVTVAILLYSTFAAIYYAKYTFLKEVENSDVDDFLIRSARSADRLHPATFLRILDAIYSSKYR